MRWKPALDEFLREQKLNEAYDAELKRLKENSIRLSNFKKENKDRLKNLRRNYR